MKMAFLLFLTLILFSEANAIKTQNEVKWEGGEHKFIGDSAWIALFKGQAAPKENKLTLKSGAVVTFGDIVGLQGDFWGSKENPLSDAPNFEEGVERFKKVFSDFPGNAGPEVKTETEQITSKFVEEYNQATKNHPVGVGKHLNDYPNFNVDYTKITLLRFPLLAAYNFDHFVHSDIRSDIDAGSFFSATSSVQRAYVVAHTAAYRTMQKARETNDASLESDAYMMEAMALHYLTDMFSAGHIRTPRRLFDCSNADTGTDLLQNLKLYAPSLYSQFDSAVLAGVALGGFVAKCMHDEDNRMGLDVTNEKGNSWRAFGDDALFDEANNENKRLAILASLTSLAEVYNSIDATNYGAPTAAETIVHESIAPKAELLEKESSVSMKSKKKDNSKLKLKHRLSTRLQSKSKSKSPITTPAFEALQYTPTPTAANFPPMFKLEEGNLMFRTGCDAAGAGATYVKFADLGCKDVVRKCVYLVNHKATNLPADDSEITAHALDVVPLPDF